MGRGVCPKPIHPVQPICTRSTSKWDILFVPLDLGIWFVIKGPSSVASDMLLCGFVPLNLGGVRGAVALNCVPRRLELELQSLRTRPQRRALHVASGSLPRSGKQKDLNHPRYAGETVGR